MKKILLFSLILILLSPLCASASGEKLATLINVVTGVKRVVVVGQAVFDKDEVLFGKSIGGRTDSNYRTYSGGLWATSSVQSIATSTAAEIGQYNTFVITPNKAGGLTYVLPTATTMPFAYNLGDVKTLYFRNATTTASTPLIIGGNTGLTFMFASSTASVATIKAGKYGRAEFIRKTLTTFEILFQAFDN